MKRPKLLTIFIVAILLMGILGNFLPQTLSELEKSETTNTWDISSQIMPEVNDTAIGNAWFGSAMGNGRMFIRLYNASSSQGNDYGRIWLEPRPFGFNGTNWVDLYESQYKYYGSTYQNTFSNSTHTWLYCRYSDQTTSSMLLKYNITFSWEFPNMKITPQHMTSEGVAQNISSMIRFDLTRFTFTKAMVPNITEPYSYSSPVSDKNVTLISTSNRANWDSNYIALYDSSHNRTLIFSWLYKAENITVMEDQTEGKFRYLYVTFANKIQNWVDYYVTHNSTFISWSRSLNSSDSVTNLKNVFSRYANMSLTAPTAITVERSSISGNTFNIQTNITYTNITNEWSITPTHYTPTFVHTIPSTYVWSERSFFGTIYFVQTDVAMGEVTWNQPYYPSWLKYVYDNFNWLAENKWLNLSVGGAWSKTLASDIYMYEHVQVLLVTSWLYEITANASLLPYIRDGADWVVSVMHDDGNVTFYFDQNGDEKGNELFCTVHHALAYAYDVTGNSTYLTYAEANANYETQNDLWMHNVTDLYHSDNEMIGFTKLYELTSNTTYKTWAQAVIKDLIDTQSTTYLSGWFATDISASSHVARGIGYYLDQVGNDITSYNLSNSLQKFSDTTWIQRDSWSGQIYGHSGYVNEYIKYPCHNEFPATAITRYAMYLVGADIQVPRIYLSHLYENMEWVFGNNELSTTFEYEGAIRRSIQLDTNSNPSMNTQTMTYDQANFMWALIWMHELYEEIVADTTNVYTTTVKLDTRTTTIDYPITNPFILSISQNLSSLTYSGNNMLAINISAESGSETTIRIYAGSKGNATSISEIDSWSYNATTTILTLTESNSSTSFVATVYWYPQSVYTTEVVVGTIVVAATGSILAWYWRRRQKNRTVSV